MLPFDPADLVALRVRPAEFARMVGVSKQCVSQWIKQGKVTLGPDGKLDPAKATREVFQRTDPARIRARVFKSAMESRDELRARIRELESSLAAERETHTAAMVAARFEFKDEQARQLSAFIDAIVDQFGDLAKAQAAGYLADALDDLTAPIFYPDAVGDAAPEAPAPPAVAAAHGDHPGADVADAGIPFPQPEAYHDEQ